jgi:multicomponent K+:H+ antiporter subunit E
VKRLLPAPGLSAALFVAWLMLSGSVSAGHLLLGAAVALTVPLLTAAWRTAPVRLRAPGTVLRLGATVLADIVRANLTVARLILGDERRITPRFVRVPLSLREPHAIVTLAGIVTMTPGTLSADVSDDRGELLVHAFDVDDAAGEAALVAEIKTRYEAPLKLIFEGDGE